jgi:hypothetical protein
MKKKIEQGDWTDKQFQAVLDYFEETQDGWSDEEAKYVVASYDRKDVFVLGEQIVSVTVEVESEQKWAELLVDIGMYLYVAGLDE